MEVLRSKSGGEEDKPLHRFVELRKLGQGNYGKVQLALDTATNEEVAVKTIKKVRVNNEKAMKRIRREIQIMSSIRHPHIIHIQEVFETGQQIIIIMPYASGGELYEYMISHQVLPDHEARRIFRQIACAVYFCHKNKICHRDLKLENILLDAEGNAQIADFGLSNTFEDGKLMSTSCGSPLYASPEIVSGMAYKGPEVDCWSLGVLLYAMVYGTMPFESKSFNRLVMQILEGRYKEPETDSSAISLIRRLLTPDASKRATIVDVCDDPWMNEGYPGSFLETADKMAEIAGRQKKPSQCLESSLQNGLSPTKRSSTNDIASKVLRKVPSNGTTENTILTQSNNNHREIYNDVLCVVSKMLEAVEASVNSDKIKISPSMTTKARVLDMRKKDKDLEKVDSAFVIPIFDVTSTIPKIGEKDMCLEETIQNYSVPLKFQADNSIKSSVSEKDVFDSKVIVDKKIDVPPGNPSMVPENTGIQSLQAKSRKIKKKKLQDKNQPSTPKTQAKKKQEPVSLVQTKDNDNTPKRPIFLRTKHHVMNLARVLSMNYEKIKHNAFKVPTHIKKPPGKLTIPQNFSSSRSATDASTEKKELVIFPMVSVSENKKKIQKKIEKIKKAALDKNFIIRSDTNTRLRIENFIRSQVRQIQNLVAEEQRSIRASFENLDEQSFQTMYYRTFGSDNTDSGIVSTEDDDYFCFLCSKATSCDGTSAFVSSATLDSIRKDSLYTSSHLHIPSNRRLNSWRCSVGNNAEFGSLTRCKSEIHLPVEYLDFIATNKTGLNTIKSNQKMTKNDLARCFYSKPSLAKIFNPTNFVLRSVSDSVGLNINGAFEIVKLNIENSSCVRPKSKTMHSFLKHASNPNHNSSEAAQGLDGCGSVSCELSQKAFAKNSSPLLKDDGIGNSDESFQSCLKMRANESGTASESRHTFATNGSMVANEQFINSIVESCLPERNFSGIEKQSGKKRSISVTSLDLLADICEIGLVEPKKVGQRLRRCYTLPHVRNQAERKEELKTEYTKSKIKQLLWDACRKEENQGVARQCTEFSRYAGWNSYSPDIKSGRDFENLYNNSKRDGGGSVSYQKLNDLLKQSNQCDKSSSYFENILMQLIGLQDISSDRKKHLGRTKSLCSEVDSEAMKLRSERRLSEINQSYASKQSMSCLEKDPFSALETPEYDTLGHRPKRRSSSSRNPLPRTKTPKSKPKKSFLHLLALKRIQEAEKELENKAHKVETEEENPNSLLEALKTHGYRSVMSQRCKNNDDDVRDSYIKKRYKSVEQVRAEVAQLNYMYYESLPNHTLDQYPNHGQLFSDQEYLPAYTLDQYSSPRQLFSDQEYMPAYNLDQYSSPRPLYSDLGSLPAYTLDHSSSPRQLYSNFDYVNGLNELSTTLPYNLQSNVSRAPKQSVSDWLNTIQQDGYSNSTDSTEVPYRPQEMATPTKKSTSRNQWYRDSSIEETTPSSYKNVPRNQWRRESSIEDSCSPETSSQVSNNNVKYDLTDRYGGRRRECLETQTSLDDDKEESVHDRILRKSFYSRFNDRVLSRRVKSTYVDGDSLSDSRLKQLNNMLGTSSDSLGRCDGYASLRSSKRKKSFCHMR